MSVKRMHIDGVVSRRLKRDAAAWAWTVGSTYLQVLQPDFVFGKPLLLGFLITGTEVLDIPRNVLSIETWMMRKMWRDIYVYGKIVRSLSDEIWGKFKRTLASVLVSAVSLMRSVLIATGRSQPQLTLDYSVLTNVALYVLACISSLRCGKAS